jgi:putative transposase
MIFNNSIEAGIILENPEDYLYSSARDYAGRNGMVEIDFID